MVWICLAVLIAALAAFLFAALLHRRLRQRRTAAALRICGDLGIAEERFVTIGGIDQWIGTRGQDRGNPVLLLIHGGPGASCSIFTPAIQSWEKHFTLVQWDQRGGGKTLRRTGKDGTGELTFERLIQDGIEVAGFVHRQLLSSKIVLLGSSLGSLIGLAMVKRRPDLFCAYVGTDQNVGMVRGRAAAHQATLERLRAAGLAKGVAALERMGSDPSRWSARDFTTNAQWTMKSDPATCRRIMSLLKSAIWFSPGHTLRDTRFFISGMEFSTARLFPELTGYDVWRLGTRFEVPFFILQGENDVLTPPSLAEEFFNDVAAPVKGMTLIQGAGHFAAFTHPEQFLRELLTRVRPRAS